MYKYNLQLFADEPNNDDAPDTDNKPDGAGSKNDTNAGNGIHTTIDFDKLMDLVQGKQKVSEDSVLKGYFKQQGLSGDEVLQAIQAFKAKKAESEPDVDAITRERDEVKNQLKEMVVQNAATLEAIRLGIAEETVPYVLKLADFSAVVDEKGDVKEGSIKEAIDKVLKDLPQLKPSEDQQGASFRIGSDGNGGDGQSSGTGTGMTSVKRWNRFR